jgi:hypothetical protein
MVGKRIGVFNCHLTRRRWKSAVHVYSLWFTWCTHHVDRVAVVLNRHQQDVVLGLFLPTKPDRNPEMTNATLLFFTIGREKKRMASLPGPLVRRSAVSSVAVISSTSPRRSPGRTKSASPTVHLGFSARTS